MKLYIAEKPSLGRAIAAALPKPQKNNQGYITLANGDVVSWCIGHILEQADPENYDPAFKKWQMAHLPIIPEQWQLKPKAQTRAQLTVLRKLVKQADEIIHAGDPDREGQLLVDEVINHVGIKPSVKKELEDKVVHARVQGDLVSAGFKKKLPFGKLETYKLKDEHKDERQGQRILNKLLSFNPLLSNVSNLGNKAIDAHHVSHWHEKKLDKIASK